MARQSTASRLAGLRRDKFGRVLTSSSSSGTPYAGDANAGNIGVGAEIYLGGQGWVDISSDIYYRDGSTKVSISRGRPNENSGSLPPPQTCSFQLNNRKNQYSPRNPAGTLYGLIGRNTPIRFWRMQNGTRRYRYAGEIPSWPTSADISNTDVYSPLTAYGMLRRLAQGSPPIQSAMYRAYTKQDVTKYFSSAVNVVAYWPCEDGSNSSQIASAQPGGSPMSISGTANFASNSSFQCSQPIPVLNGSKWTGNVSTYTGGSANVIRFLLNVPTGGDTDNIVLARALTSGTVARLDMVYHNPNGLALIGYDAGDTSLFSTASIAFNTDGALMRVSMAMTQSGANINWEIQTYTVDAGGAPIFGGTLNNATIGNVSSIGINPTGALTKSAVGHVSVQNVYQSIFDIIDAVDSHDLDGTDRITRLCQEEGINQVTVDGTPFPGHGYGDGSGLDYPMLMGKQTPDTFLDMIKQCMDTDLGFLYEARDQVALCWRPRFTLYNQGTAYGTGKYQLTLDWNNNQLSQIPTPTDDDLYTRNDVTVQQINGTSSRQVLADGSALSISSPPTGVGEYATTYSISLGNDGFLAANGATLQPQATIADHAGWRLHMGTVDEPRFPQISVNLRHPTFQNNLDMMNAALSVDIGDVIEIDNPPAWISYDPIRLVILGYQEKMGAFEHDITFNCAPESPYRVAVLDDPVLSRADTDGSTLASPLSTILNGNPFMAGGSSVGWSPFGGSMALIGTSGSSNPLPSGGPTGYGLLFTADGTSFANLFEGAAANTSFSVVPGQTYYVSALVYYPSALNQVFVSVNFYDSGFSFIPGTNTPFTVPANTWTAISSSFVAPANAAFGAPSVGLVGATSNGDTLYATNVVCWSGAVLVGTTNPASPLWTTSSSDFPFDIAVGGERMTVTGVSGSSSPQTFTVARSVNGVAKPQSAGTDVRLWQPMILSL